MTQRRSAPPKRRMMMDIRTLHVFSSIELAQLRQGVNNAARLSSLYLEQLVHAKICALVFHIIFVRPSVRPSIHPCQCCVIHLHRCHLPLFCCGHSRVRRWADEMQLKPSWNRRGFGVGDVLHGQRRCDAWNRRSERSSTARGWCVKETTWDTCVQRHSLHVHVWARWRSVPLHWRRDNRRVETHRWRSCAWNGGNKPWTTPTQDVRRRIPWPCPSQHSSRSKKKRSGRA